jgi:hydrogenase nickel incorporation protein HypA/HybF
MHELSLAGSILAIVEQAAARDGFARVARLQLEAGRLSGVEPEALRFALAAVARGTCLDGAELLIDEPAARGTCADCGRVEPVLERGQACPGCGSPRLVPQGGDRLRVVELLVAD